MRCPWYKGRTSRFYNFFYLIAMVTFCCGEVLYVNIILMPFLRVLMDLLAPEAPEASR